MPNAESFRDQNQFPPKQDQPVEFMNPLASMLVGEAKNLQPVKPQNQAVTQVHTLHDELQRAKADLAKISRPVINSFPLARRTQTAIASPYSKRRAFTSGPGTTAASQPPKEPGEEPLRRKSLKRRRPTTSSFSRHPRVSALGMSGLSAHRSGVGNQPSLATGMLPWCCGNVVVGRCPKSAQ